MKLYVKYVIILLYRCSFLFFTIRNATRAKQFLIGGIMFYPEDFKARVRKAYPDWQLIQEKLDNGSTFVGRLLDDNRSTGLSFETILSATSLEELQDKARAEKEKDDLYAEWSKLYLKQMPKS